MRRHREAVEPLVLMLAPLAPHICRGAVAADGGTTSRSPAARSPWPTRSGPGTEQLTIPVQVKGKLRATIVVPAGTTEADLEAARPRPTPRSPATWPTAPWRAIVVPGRLVNFVPA